MGPMVIAAYRPKPGQEEALVDLVAEHIPTLRAEGLVTEREPVVMRAGDGTIVEVFEWASSEAVDAAHENANVKALWDRFAELCDHVPLRELDETAHPFAHFERVDRN